MVSRKPGHPSSQWRHWSGGIRPNILLLLRIQNTVERAHLSLYVILLSAICSAAIHFQDSSHLVYDVPLAWRRHDWSPSPAVYQHSPAYHWMDDDRFSVHGPVVWDGLPRDLRSTNTCMSLSTSGIDWKNSVWRWHIASHLWLVWIWAL